MLLAIAEEKSESTLGATKNVLFIAQFSQGGYMNLNIG